MREVIVTTYERLKEIDLLCSQVYCNDSAVALFSPVAPSKTKAGVSLFSKQERFC